MCPRSMQFFSWLLGKNWHEPRAHATLRAPILLMCAMCPGSPSAAHVACFAIPSCFPSRLIFCRGSVPRPTNHRVLLQAVGSHHRSFARDEITPGWKGRKVAMAEVQRRELLPNDEGDQGDDSHAHGDIAAARAVVGAAKPYPARHRTPCLIC